MSPRRIVTILLLALVVVSAGYLVAGGSRGRSAAPEPGAGAAAGEVSARPDRVIAYYFHGSQRCRTCMTIEAYTAEAIQSGFADALSRGDLVWRVVNIEDPGNEHFVEDYQITTRTVVLVKVEDGKEVRWSSLDRVWELVDDQLAFMAYIQDETRGYLGS